MARFSYREVRIPVGNSTRQTHTMTSAPAILDQVTRHHVNRLKTALLLGLLTALVLVVGDWLGGGPG
jgi:hypothetical protein